MKSNMRASRKVLSWMNIGLGDSVATIRLPYKHFSPVKLIQHAHAYINKPFNPVRRVLRFGNTVFIRAPVVIPLVSTWYIFCVGTGVIGGSLIIAGGTAMLPLTILYDFVVLGHKQINTFIDLFNEEIPENPLPEIQERGFVESHVIVLKELKVSEVPKIQTFTSYTQDYIQSFEGKIPYSEQIKKLQLTDRELLRFEKYLDPVTHNIIDIPVKLNDHVYDLSTIYQLGCDKKLKDPFNNIPFELSEVASDRDTSEQIQALIRHIHKRKMSADNESKFKKTFKEDPIKQTRRPPDQLFTVIKNPPNQLSEIQDNSNLSKIPV